MGCGTSSLVSHASNFETEFAAAPQHSKASKYLIANELVQHQLQDSISALRVPSLRPKKCPVENGSHTIEEVHNGQTVLVSRCPFAHGSVGTGPFPGYVHGTHPAVCEEGCRPDPQLGKYGRKGETPKQTLIREALEYQDLYHKDKESPPGVKEARVAEILDDIKRTGTYHQTFAELEHGARVAWRNAPKCSNRKFWEDLKLLDARSATTPAEMNSACLELLERATLSCVTTANIAVFRAQTPGTHDGPRVWNNQLIRFAGYKRPDGSIVGDPSEVDFTAMCIKEFGWMPPTEGGGMFDVLPLLMQPNPDQPPQMFYLPDQYVVRVPIRHPEHEGFAALGLQWYTIPAVSNMEMSVGGLTYTAVPFNGWYADTEIVRNLTDATRYNVCAAVAAVFKLDTADEASMWRDRTILEVSVAVMHSFRQAGMGMVDHHSLMRNFFTWYKKEKVRRGYVPGNWKWIITPMSPTANRCYLELNKMTEYTIKPGFWYSPGWKKYRKALGPCMQASLAPSPAASRARTMTRTMSIRPADTTSIVILYASVTGNTQQYAQAVTKQLSRPGSGLSVTLMSVEDSDYWSDAICTARCVILMSSTYGPGAPPSSANKFISWLQAGDGEAEEVFSGKPCCVLGFGSSCYPRFCAAADLLYSMLLSVGAVPMLPVAKADAMSGEEQTVWTWVQNLVHKFQEMEFMDSSIAAALVEQLPITDSDKPPEFHQEYRLVQLQGDGLQHAPERGCHWATVIESEELLTDAADGSSTKLVRLDISEVACGNYLAGDEVCIWGENDAELVEHFATQLGITAQQLDIAFLLQSIQGGDGDDMLAVAAKGRLPLPNSYRTILTRHAGLNERISFAAIAALAGCAPEDAPLQKLASSYAEYSKWANDVLPRWQDLFILFPSLVQRVPLATFFQLVPVIKPRYYSISSSGAVTPNEVAVTVGKLTYTVHNGEKRAGFCSSFLSRVQAGSKLRFRLTSQPAFRLPLNLTSPVLMIASGTGIAPFRGFWQERLLRMQQMQQLGPAVLVYGCRRRDRDFLLKDEIQCMLDHGAIGQLLLALSREPGTHKTYVQDIIKQQADMLGVLLEHPRCHVYVCGSSNMAQEVSAAVAKVAGKRTLDAMLQAGRYHEDVFGVSVSDHKAVYSKSVESQTIRRMAAQHVFEVQAQLDMGFNIDAADETGSTLLHHACRMDRQDLLELLLSRGASANIVNLFGLTPAGEAAAAGNSQLSSVLDAHGCKRASTMHKSFYVLHAAMMEQDAGALAAALARGANPDQQDYQLVAPLHIAVALADTQLATQLLDAGADPNIQNRLGMTPLQLAVAQQKQGMKELLCAKGASIQAANITAAVNPTADLWNAESQAGLQSTFGVGADDVARVRSTWAFVSGEAFPDQAKAQMEEFGVQLFLALFDLYPNLLNLFPLKDANGKPDRVQLAVHGLKVADALSDVVHMLQNLRALSRYLTYLIERHFQYGVELVHYDVVLGAIAVFLGSLLGNEKLTAADREAWQKVLNIIKLVAKDCYHRRDAAAGRTQ